MESGINIYIQSIMKYPILNYEETMILLKKVKENDKLAYQRLIECNLRYVLSLANQYRGRGLSFEDLISEGNLGLIKGLSRFDMTKETRITTYVKYWIRKSILEAIEVNGKNMHIPARVMQEIRDYKKVSAKLMTELGREPNLEEIRKEMNISRKKIEEIVYTLESNISLNTKVNYDEEELIDIIESKQKTPEDEVIGGMMDRSFLVLMKSILTKRQYEVIRLKMINPKLTDQVIGNLLHISSNRVSQLTKDGFLRIEKKYYLENHIFLSLKLKKS